MKMQQRGFTLIELVVVIVILGILAATAIPRFANLTDQANTAVAEGILGAILSSAVIQFGEQGSGAAVPWASIFDNTQISLPSNPAVATVTITGDGTVETINTNATGSCNAGANTILVTIETSTAQGTIPSGLCDN